jgi:hypothetical protein
MSPAAIAANGRPMERTFTLFRSRANHWQNAENNDALRPAVWLLLKLDGVLPKGGNAGPLQARPRPGALTMNLTHFPSQLVG